MSSRGRPNQRISPSSSFSSQEWISIHSEQQRNHALPSPTLDDDIDEEVYCIYLSPLLSEVIFQWWQLILSCLNVWWNVLVEPTLKDSTLHGISILCLACHYLQSYIEVYATTSTWQVTIPVWISTGLPVVLSTTLACIAVSLPYFTRSSLDQDAVMVTSLVLLFVLEAMLPLIILGCLSIILWENQVSIVTCILTFAGIWTCVTCATLGLRSFAYQRMVHG
jgi:hypothetical protein